MGKARRPFNREFKVEAVKLITEQRRSFAEAAADLGIAESLLRKWNKDLDDQGDQAFPGKGNLPALEEELRRHKELRSRGLDCCVNTVAKLMRRQGIAAKTKRKFRDTTDSDHDRPVADKIRDRRPWATDPPGRV